MDVGRILATRACWLWALLFACAAHKPSAGGPSGEPVPALKLPADVQPLRYRVEVAIDKSAGTFAGSAEIDVRVDEWRDVIWLHARGLEVRSAAARDQRGERIAGRFAQANDDGVASLELPREIRGFATLEFAFAGKLDERLNGLYAVTVAGEKYVYAQFWDINARRIFPCFDEPGFKTPFSVSLVVPESDTAITNALPAVEEPAGPGKKRVRFEATAPLPTYLLAWAVGPFDVVSAPELPADPYQRGKIPVRGIAPRGRGGDLGFALQASRELLLLEEQYFGIAYPYPKLDSVAVPDFPLGAMENAGQVHYRADLLLTREGVTSQDRLRGAASTIAHEQSHQWFGDLVTMPWWDEAWLNESFATWMAARITPEWRPQWSSGIELVRAAQFAMGNDALSSARAIRQPLASIREIPGQFDVLTYQKGAAVIGMFERFIGREAFRKGVSQYVHVYMHGSGSTDALLDSLARASGKPELPAAFKTFLDQPGVPLVRASLSCDGQPKLQLEQQRYAPLGVRTGGEQLWRIPVCARLGKDERCLLLSERRAELPLESCPAFVLPNADGAGYYRWALDARGLAALAAHAGELNRAERISFADAVRAGVASGAIAIASALAALEPLTRDADAEVAMSATGALLPFVRDDALAGDAAPIDAYARKLFSPLLDRLGFAPAKGEPLATRRLRTHVLTALADARDPRTIAELARLGRAYAGETAFDAAAVAPELTLLALSTAVEEGDAALFDRLQTRLDGLTDTALRDRVLRALGAARSAELSARALQLSLDPKLLKQETVIPLARQMGDPRTRPAAWDFLRAHFDELRPRMPDFRAAQLPNLAAGFCDEGRAAELEAFFAPRAAAIAGMPLALKQAAEQIRLCAAQAAAQRESARAFFQGR